MKLNKVLVLFALPFIAQITMAVCCCDDDGGAPPTLEPLSLCPIDSVVLYVLNNAGNEPVVLDSDSLNKAAFGIRMDLISNNVASHCHHRKPMPSVFSSAFALACDCNDYNNFSGPLAEVLDFQITSLNHINSKYPANSVVTDLFRERKGDAVGAINTTFFSTSTSKDYILMQAPDSSGIYQFAISLTLANASILKATTEKVYLYEN
tara:strand:- start:721 stop:1341 length:621 start_codon:yes stop_codon:yes gene_type:complete